MRIRYHGIDHVQIAAPVGSEAAARAYYVELLEMTELPKPADTAARGGAWFACGSHQLHVGVEVDFRPARKAHPALRMSDVSVLNALAARLTAQGYRVTWSAEVPGQKRFHTDDPFGNRLEFLCAEA